MARTLMYAISYRGVTGTLSFDGAMWRGRLCLIPYMASYCGITADACIAAFHQKVDAWIAFDVEPIPTDGAPEFPGPFEPEPIPE